MKIELNVPARPCFCQIIGDQAAPREQATARESGRNAGQKGVD